MDTDPNEQSPEETQPALSDGKNELNVHRVRVGVGGENRRKGGLPCQMLSLSPEP